MGVSSHPDAASGLNEKMKARKERFDSSPSKCIILEAKTVSVLLFVFILSATIPVDE